MRIANRYNLNQPTLKLGVIDLSSYFFRNIFVATIVKLKSLVRLNPFVIVTHVLTVEVAVYSKIA